MDFNCTANFSFLPTGGKICWCDSVQQTVECANLDGSGRSVVVLGDAYFGIALTDKTPKFDYFISL